MQASVLWSQTSDLEVLREREKRAAAQAVQSSRPLPAPRLLSVPG